MTLKTQASIISFYICIEQVIEQVIDPYFIWTDNYVTGFTWVSGRYGSDGQIEAISRNHLMPDQAMVALKLI